VNECIQIQVWMGCDLLVTHLDGLVYVVANLSTEFSANRAFIKLNAKNDCKNTQKFRAEDPRRL
jgi:hypothetical protein